MCGIVGLFLKNPALRPTLGRRFEAMLIGMSERGPDSAGFAVYHDPAGPGACKLTLFHPDETYPWREMGGRLSEALDAEVEVVHRANHAVLRIEAADAPARAWIADHHPEVHIMGWGQAMEVYKDKGLPREVAAKFGIAAMSGSHAIGHTRMATESAVTTEHSHPFTAAADMCLVHNGSLSNYNRLRRWLERKGLAFETDNDSEVAARYFAFRMAEGASLTEAMEAGLKDLDGFYTLTMGTRDGFAVLRDGIACKPAVLAETGDWVAMASEFRSLADLPGIEAAKVWEPEPAKIYTWTLKDAA